MRTADVELEPVDHVVAGFPAGQVNVSGEMASERAALRESNAVRLSDLLLLTKEVDGSVRPLSCARPTTARSASSPACRRTWNRIGDCLRADVRRPRRRRRRNWTGPSCAARRSPPHEHGGTSRPATTPIGDKRFTTRRCASPVRFPLPRGRGMSNQGDHMKSRLAARAFCSAAW